MALASRRSGRTARAMTEGFSMPARWTKAREEVPRMHDNGQRFRLSLATWVTPRAPSPRPLTGQRGRFNGDDILRTTESILSFDDDFDEFSRKLQQLSKEWEASGLRASQR